MGSHTPNFEKPQINVHKEAQWEPTLKRIKALENKVKELGELAKLADSLPIRVKSLENSVYSLRNKLKNNNKITTEEIDGSGV